MKARGTVSRTATLSRGMEKSLDPEGNWLRAGADRPHWYNTYVSFTSVFLTTCDIPCDWVSGLSTWGYLHARLTSSTCSATGALGLRIERITAVPHGLTLPCRLPAEELKVTQQSARMHMNGRAAMVSQKAWLRGDAD